MYYYKASLCCCGGGHVGLGKGGRMTLLCTSFLRALQQHKVDLRGKAVVGGGGGAVVNTSSSAPLG